MEKFSYSKLNTFDQCPYKYKLVYLDGYRSEESTIALDLGSTAHKGKELWGEYLRDNQEPDLEYIMKILKNGIEYWKIVIVNGIEIENVLEENILGIDEIKSKHFDSYFEKCNKSGMTYDEKFDIYLKNLKNKELPDEWKVLDVEKDFSFIYQDKYKLTGFIDRIDINQNGELRVVDYKTSKDIYKPDKLATPLQMFIYTLACEYLYGKQPVEHVYDFIFLDQVQNACTKGYYNRGLKKLDKLLNAVELCVNKEEFIPKPAPLCYWCSFCKNTPLSDPKLNHLCDYYSLWTPNDKRFDVNKKWGDFTEKKEVKDKEPKKEFVW